MSTSTGRPGGTDPRTWSSSNSSSASPPPFCRSCRLFHSATASAIWVTSKNCGGGGVDRGRNGWGVMGEWVVGKLHAIAQKLYCRRAGWSRWATAANAHPPFWSWGCPARACRSRGATPGSGAQRRAGPSTTRRLRVGPAEGGRGLLGQGGSTCSQPMLQPCPTAAVS